MSDNKNRWGNIFAIICVILCILLPISFLYGPNALILGLIICNFIAGPACLVGYLLEVRKGVFSNDED